MRSHYVAHCQQDAIDGRRDFGAKLRNDRAWQNPYAARSFTESRNAPQCSFERKILKLRQNYADD